MYQIDDFQINLHLFFNIQLHQKTIFVNNV